MKLPGIPCLFVSLTLSCLQPLHAETVTIASASNFRTTLDRITTRFESLTSHQARVSHASTGKLYAQILHGAPFDLFLAADRERPALLAGQGRSDTPFTYATGRLVFWTRQAGVTPGPDTLSEIDHEKIAMANPKTAPYGKAAVSVMRNLGVEQKLKDNLVFGDNIAQAFQFSATGNAAYGFVALAQTQDRNPESTWIIPQDLYAPIRQDAVLLERGRSNPAAVAFLAFLQSSEAKALIRQSGYEVD